MFVETPSQIYPNMSCRHNHTEDSCLSLMHTDNRTCIKTIKCMCVETKPHQPITAKNMMWHTRLWKKKKIMVTNELSCMTSNIWKQIQNVRFTVYLSFSVYLSLIPASIPQNRLNYVGWKQKFCGQTKKKEKTWAEWTSEQASDWMGKGKEIVMSITYHQNKHNIYRPIYKNLLILMILPLYSDVYSTSYISLQCSQYTTHNNISKRQHTHESQARVNEWEKI